MIDLDKLQEWFFIAIMIFVVAMMAIVVVLMAGFAWHALTTGFGL
jgi:hypothetical protein